MPDEQLVMLASWIQGGNDSCKSAGLGGKIISKQRLGGTGSHRSHEGKEENREFHGHDGTHVLKENNNMILSPPKRETGWLLWVVLHCHSWSHVVWNDAANVCVNCHRKILGTDRIDRSFFLWNKKLALMFLARSSSWNL
jgi:hypothetical protein